MKLDSTSESDIERVPEKFDLASELDFDPGPPSRMPLASLLYCILVADPRVYSSGDRRARTA